MKNNFLLVTITLSFYEQFSSSLPGIIRLRKYWGPPSRKPVIKAQHWIRHTDIHLYTTSLGFYNPAIFFISHITSRNGKQFLNWAIYRELLVPCLYRASSVRYTEQGPLEVAENVAWEWGRVAGTACRKIIFMQINMGNITISCNELNRKKLIC